MNKWGNSFYKTYEAMNYLDAKEQCEFDGAYLASPKSDDENAFIANLIPNENIWIGLNDIDEEGTFVSVDNQNVSYTKWHTASDQPDNWINSQGIDEDGVHIKENAGGFWNDLSITDQLKFVCISNLVSNSPSK